MKKIFSLLFVLVTIVHAYDAFDTSTQCNDGMLGVTSSSSSKNSSSSSQNTSSSSSSKKSSSSSGYNQPEIPPASCSMLATRIAPGFNLSGTASDPSLFFFDTFYYIKINNKDLRVRFVIYDDEKDFNSIQAIVQTAYATRAPLSINFPNPMLNVLDYNSYINFKKSGQPKYVCYTVSDLTGLATSLLCPIQSIQLGTN